MATQIAIGAVSSAILRVLKSGLNAPQTTVEVKLFGAEDFQRNAFNEATVSVFLYRIAANTNRRCLPWRTLPDGRRLRPSLPLDLFYLISGWGKAIEMRHELLGRVVRTIEDSPTLPASFLNHGYYQECFRPGEAIELVFEPVSLTDMSSLGDMLRAHIQPSLTYVARAVELDSEIEIGSGSEVVEREFLYHQVIDNPQGWR